MQVRLECRQHVVVDVDSSALLLRAVQRGGGSRGDQSLEQLPPGNAILMLRIHLASSRHVAVPATAQRFAHLADLSSLENVTGR